MPTQVRPVPAAPTRALRRRIRACEVRALGAVERMELVDYEPAEGVWTVVPPEPLVARAAEEVVQHLVVGEENVRRPLNHDLAVGENVVGGHRGSGLMAGPDPHRCPQ